ncbi:hypothetical protein F0562_009151 [Nyssa sinensis]|uniref:Uncharacterized protein n=1 Tax=Nyssa sinensis TaxID=561372 RepID=A0A5J5A004_9ASTE|nr:hypothetical protein F0562_009151 [Nyssa sinensis]
MASTIKKVNNISQIVRFKQVMQRWKSMSLKRRSVISYSDDSDASSGSVSNRRIPSGSLAVYVGAERRRFVIPTRFLNLPVFVSLLNKAEEEFGFQSSGGLVLPCEVGFFRGVLQLLERDERRLAELELDTELALELELDTA